MKATFDWLMAEAVPLTPQSIITVDISAKRIAEIDAEDCETCGDINSNAQRVRIGLVEPVGYKVNFGDALVRTPDGGFVWTAAVDSRNATALRVHFTNFSLPENAALYVYNMNGEAFGPYTGLGPGNEGDFWSHTVSGPVAFIQVRHFGPAAQENLSSAPFVIDDIGYIGPKFLLPFLQKSPEERGDISRTEDHCDYNEPCVEDAKCHNVSAVADAKDAVAYMEWVSGAWIYSCSGGLIADTDTSTDIPYFLTANHCVSKSRDAAGLECYFQYWTPYCGGCADTTGPFPRTLGADVVKTDRDGDYSLLRLREDPPSGSAFLGWNANPVATADGTNLYRISHPSGAPQAYSQHEVDSQYIECSGLPIGEFIYSQDIVGATEGGSSGSPVVNGSGQIVGQLYGGCGYNINDVCDAEQNRTVDGAFAFYFNDVKPWLDPGPPPEGKMHVHAIDVSLKTAGPNNTAKAVVTIFDQNNNPVEGATVTGAFSGDVSGTQSGVTGADGTVTFSVKTKTPVSTFTFCVTGVTHASLTYDPTANFADPPCATY
jgi:V8-like Glu-specific endopeptidase